jgi:hypothetical protein
MECAQYCTLYGVVHLLHIDSETYNRAAMHSFYLPRCNNIFRQMFYGSAIPLQSGVLKHG